MIDKFTKESLLFDFYGQLLSTRKRQVTGLYYGEDLSLSEIAEQFGISRSSVHESLKSAEKSLEEYEEKLGLVKKYFERAEIKDEIKKRISDIREDMNEDSVYGKLDEIDNLIQKLD